jgi:hypothetical protein
VLVEIWKTMGGARWKYNKGTDVYNNYGWGASVRACVRACVLLCVRECIWLCVPPEE